MQKVSLKFAQAAYGPESSIQLGDPPRCHIDVWAGTSWRLKAILVEYVLASLLCKLRSA